MNFIVIIPARYASSRLPGKPLLSIAGKPMIQHVYERAVDSGAAEVIIATDDTRIHDVAIEFGATVALTSAEHPSGSDRLAEVVEQQGFAGNQIIVNLQGDEPLMPPALIRQVADNLHQHTQASVSTLCERIRSAKDLFDTNIVKVVTDKDSMALTFSRAPIPWNRDVFSVSTESLPQDSCHYRHIGLYAYRAEFISRYVSWPPCVLEQMESLEQLRVLWQGFKIHVAVAMESPGHGVDTESDLKHAEQLMLKSL